MDRLKFNIHIIIFLSLILTGLPASSQTAWFADGYHGGVYGHYPLWQARFMVEKLIENPEWKINLEIEPETWDTVSVKDSENFKAFQEYYKTKGRFGRIEFVNPAYAQPYCYNISGESIIRQFGYGIAKIKEYFTDATFQTYSVEEPCFTSSLPQILKGFGYKYAVLRNPNTCWGGYTSGFGKDLVNWIGPDGTSIVTVPRYACEGLSEESTWQTDSWTNSNEFISTCLNVGVKYPVGMCFQDAGWDGGPWGNKYQPTVYTTWTDYFEMVKDKVEASDWQFTQEDIKPGLVWGSQVLQIIAQEVRVSENRLIVAEKMASLDYLFNNKTWPEADFAEAWRTLMLAQHHDCWIVPYNGKPGDTWADKVTRWTNSSNQIAEEKISSLFNGKDSGDSDRIRVYNTLGSERSDLVKMVLPEGFNDKNLYVLNSKDEKVPSQVSKDSNGNTLLYFKATVPGMGYTTYKLKREEDKKHQYSVGSFTDESLKIETDFYSVTINPIMGGAITSLIDKKNDSRQLVEEGKLLNNLKGYFYEKGKNLQGADNTAKVSVVEDGELFTRLKVENQSAGNPYLQLITFYKDNPRIDFVLHIDWNGQPGIGAYDQNKDYKAEGRTKAFYNDEYKLHLEFPFNDLGERLFKDAPFDVCETQLENTYYSTWDSIKHNVILNWVDVTNQTNDYGVALFSDHTTSYLNSEDLPLGLTVQYVGKGLWGRNYRIHGSTEIKYSLLPHTGNWEKAQVQKINSEWNEPLIAHFYEGSDNLVSTSLLDISDKNLEVSSATIKNGALFVRFYNSSSENIKQKIHWNCKAEKIERVDLNGDSISSVPFEKGQNGQLSTEISLPKFGFLTFKITGVDIN